ncbi:MULTISPECIES: hypothetical protein [unclassified Curtobacterium]|uniref:hypothetical protein n=1 Tax=unclassified Curtobacterium TaxID=257496 RepID=UPI000D84F4CF|nr:MULTISPECIES: hypothetical protein [unclassified Curtobacterium]PYY64075.1 hypothetical protein DEJ30_09985 [Curtobacterium sp. MCPF17_003]WIB70277.1 hypothetical protein DEI85_14155 [Curtobacterium sp. MCBD17_026]
MTEHLIEYVARDRTGITAVVTPTGVIDVDTVIQHIRAGHAGYYVAADSWKRTPVRSMSFIGGTYLFANWDGSKRNMLHDLAFRSPTRSIETTHEPESRFSRFLDALFGKRTPQL